MVENNRTECKRKFKKKERKRKHKVTVKWKNEMHHIHTKINKKTNNNNCVAVYRIVDFRVPTHNI